MAIHVDHSKDVFFSGDYDGTIKKWKLSDMSLITTWRAHPEGAPVYSLAGNDTSLFSSSCDGEIKEWEKATGEFLQMTIVIVS